SPRAPAITGTLPLRLFRYGPPCTDMCNPDGGNVFPGTDGFSGAFPYDAYTYTNPSSSPVFVTASLTVNSQNANYEIAAFLAPFASTDISYRSRHLGDPGLSR